MGEIIMKIVKWTALITIISSMLFTFSALMFFILSGLVIVLSASVISDIFAIIQIWLPFNLVPVMLWLFTIASLYLTYKVARFAFDYVRQFLTV